ncbi:TraB/GumN family protein [Bacteroides sp. OttesenSCG-928-D19]|nr:TraB/GumN family protein [Bacteroides sp. OttesenSCG-928-N06]MDL2303986.1 TraB/GumN family protein [Bacteroides sp. OttesenSCG-928-D19]
MKRILTVLVIACVALGAHAQLLWKVTGNGLEKPSFVFGTHHLAPLSILDSIKGFSPALAEATHIVGEVDMAGMMSQETMLLMRKYMFIEGDTTLKTLLTEEEFELANEFSRANLMLDLNTAPNIRPAFISNNVTIVIYTKHIKDFNPLEQLDLYVQQEAKKAGKTVSGLETMEFQLDLLFNSQSLQRQATLLMCSLKDTEKVFDAAKRLTDAYMAQELDKLYAIAQETNNDQCDSLPGEMEAILDTRNLNWMEALPEMMKKESTFIAIGALHLVGDNGLINLLRKSGYTVEAVD